MIRQRLRETSAWFQATDRVIRARPEPDVSRLATWMRIALHQLRSRLTRSYDLKWTSDAKLRIERRASGLTGNVYFGLHEWPDMPFIRDLLRPDDLFIDGGANAGSYTVLASKVSGATTIAVEPGFRVLPLLLANVDLNHIRDRTQILQVALGDAAGLANFTDDATTTNRLSDVAGVVAVPVTTLDQITDPRKPTAIKLDLEGGELAALKGASNTLRDPTLLALLVELRHDDVRDLLQSHGFGEMHYEPTRRELTEGRSGGNNAIWVRRNSMREVTERLASSTVE